MARNTAWSFTLFGIFAACAIQATTTFGQVTQGGAAGGGDPVLGPAEARALMMKLYAGYRRHKPVQTGVNPAFQQQMLMQQQMLLEQQLTAEKATKREAERERKLDSTRERRAKEVKEREQRRQEAKAAATATAEKNDGAAR